MSFKERAKATCIRVKTHIVENKTIYLTGGAALVSGVVIGVIATRSDGEDSYEFTLPAIDYNGGGNTNVAIEAESITDSPIHIEQTTNVTNNFGGHATKIVRRIDTGEIFESVNAAADFAGVDSTKMSHHLNGRKDHIYGNRYEIIGLGTTS